MCYNMKLVCYNLLPHVNSGEIFEKNWMFDLKFGSKSINLFKH
jgi:hypothetical protein